MAQTFLHARHHCLLVADFGEDHPVGMKPGLRQRGREQIAPRHAPQHLSGRAGGDPGGKQRSGRAMDRAIAAASDLMQRAQRQPAARHLAVHGLDSEGQDATRALTARFDTGNLFAERG